MAVISINVTIPSAEFDVVTSGDKHRILKRAIDAAFAVGAGTYGNKETAQVWVTPGGTCSSGTFTMGAGVTTGNTAVFNGVTFTAGASEGALAFLTVAAAGSATACAESFVKVFNASANV